MSIDPDRLYNQRAAAKALGVGYTTIRGAVQRGDIRARAVFGKQRLITGRDLLGIMDQYKEEHDALWKWRHRPADVCQCAGKD